MGLIMAVFSGAMVVLCLILICLVLIQTPMADTAAGLEVHEAAPERSPDARSVSALVELTRYTGAAFFLLALFLSFLQNLPLR